MSLSFIPTSPLKTAVLFLVFNRPQPTKLVFEAIRQAKPPRLYIASDGARDSRINEANIVSSVRDFILSNIDWECEVKTLFREKNLGCKRAVSSAITWFFENEEMGIILEDDCLPSQSFFWYCEELLEKYKDNDQTMIISGNNFQQSDLGIDTSYYFSRYVHIWGWASWRRAWKNYTVDINSWPTRGLSTLKSTLDNRSQVKFWEKKFLSVYEGKIDTWDYQLTFSSWLHNSFAILPSVNLVSNIGFGEDATHTVADSPFSNMKKFELRLPLKHPRSITRNIEADLFTENIMFSGQGKKPLSMRINRKINKILGLS